MILLSLFVSIIYLLLIASFAFGFDKVSTFKLSDNAAKTTFSIIIPFRNEATHLPDLLKTIETLNYPKHLFEIIFIDDNSEDDSAEIIRKAINSNPFIKTAIRIIIKPIPNLRYFEFTRRYHWWLWNPKTFYV